jgi:hypothetical protein
LSKWKLLVTPVSLITLLECLAGDFRLLAESQLIDILMSNDPTQHYPFPLRLSEPLDSQSGSLLEFNAQNPLISNEFLQKPLQTLPIMESALELAQQDLMSTHLLRERFMLKPHVHPRISIGSPLPDVTITKIPRYPC